MTLKDYLHTLRNNIDKRLQDYLPRTSEEPGTLHRAMRYSVFSGGKRIRPILTIESSRVCGGGPKDSLPAACAVELIHTYSLIHDDLPAMDNDDYRRGKPTCHKVFGEAYAILAGDALLTLGFNIISTELRPRVSLRVMKELSNAIGTKGMIGGQVQDLRYKGKRVDGVTLERINRLKTSKLFEASTKIGAITAGSGPKRVKAMADFGASLGLAFQMVDDIIDGEVNTRALGIEVMRRESENLTRKAKSALDIFGSEADRLKEIADSVLNRAR